MSDMLRIDFYLQTASEHLQRFEITVNILLFQVFQVTMKTFGVERREVEKQASVEEEIAKKEVLER